MPDRRPWTSEEDEALKYLREELAINKWSLIAKKLAQEYQMHGRTGKQCRQRYHNHLDSTIRHTEWTKDEEFLMYKLHDQFGNKWALISQKMPGRTDNCVKNHFYSKLRKSIRKLNKVIHDSFKKEFKEIKITILYKLIEAADEKFKNSPSIDEEISQNCCRLKRILLEYSNDEQNEYQDDLQKLKGLVKSIYEFSSSYRRKPKRCRKTSGQANDLLKIPHFEKKNKISSDRQGSQSEYSFVFSHSDADIEDEEDDGQMEGLKRNGKMLNDVMEEQHEKYQGQQRKKFTVKEEQDPMESQKEYNIDDIFIEGKISIPIPMMGRTASLKSQNSEDGNQKMFIDYINDSPDIINEFNCMNNNLSDDEMEDENSIFHN